MMTESDLLAIEQRAQRATAPPWFTGDGWEYECVKTDAGVLIGYDDYGAVLSPEDAAFVAAARTDIPVLVQEVRRLRQVVSAAWDYGWEESGEGHNAEYCRRGAKSTIDEAKARDVKGLLG